MGFLIRSGLIFGLTCIAQAQIIFHIDAATTNDGDGSENHPFSTIQKAVEAIPEASEGAVTLRIHPGGYVLDGPITLDRGRFNAQKRLSIEAAILPDDPGWTPKEMPRIRSIEDPGKAEGRGKPIYGFRVAIPYAVFRGLRFEGNAAIGHRYYPIRRDDNTLNGLEVSQCLFNGNREKSPIHVAVIARGHGIVVEHNIFKQCRNPTVFWVAEGGNSYGNAYRYNIAFDSYQSGLWTTDTASDFDFHHNIFQGGKVFHNHRFARESLFSFKQSYIVGFQHWRRLVDGPGGGEAPNPAPLTIREFRLFRDAELQFDLEEAKGTNRRWLHPLPGTPGSELGAGLFKGQPNH